MSDQPRHSGLATHSAPSAHTAEAQAMDPEPIGADPKEPRNYYNHAMAVDRLCRGFFPGAFVIFNLIYWPYYLMRQHTPQMMDDTTFGA
ncbi:Gamma-aminobutyric acid receptor subunit alpha-1 [Portunus trituberculatus]|uniref:Gamma-aminobutyric acid receptor subunit alpha-1 n=1 Tax=Portunus trituberculatus TaxID=210409 RepID=A0A5B7DJH5_PORTR|nr:Gamma-aminobutyric acid receptor subunit alpha-1 [Portunus trituberculatus]